MATARRPRGLLVALALAVLPSLAWSQPCPVTRVVAPSQPSTTPLPPAPPVLPRPDPTPAQLEALRQLEAEGAEFIARGRQFRADVEQLSSSREELADRHRRTLLVPGPLATVADNRRESLVGGDPARLAAILDAATPGTARYIDALEALAAALAQPDRRLDARCQALVAAIAGAPRHDAFACASLLRVVAPNELTDYHPTASWTPTVDARRPWRPALLLQLAADALHLQRDDEGVALLRVFGALYPLDPSAPAAVERLTATLDALGRTEPALAAEASLADFVEGSPWHCANRDDGALVERTAAVVDRHLRHAATAWRERAQRATGDEARRAHETAVRLLTALIGSAAPGESTDEVRWLRAQALAGAGRHEEAADAFAELSEYRHDEEAVIAAARSERDEREAHLIALDPCLAVRAGIDPSAVVDANGRPRLDDVHAAACAAIPTDDGVTVRELAIPRAVALLLMSRSFYATSLHRHSPSPYVPAANDDAPPGETMGPLALRSWLEALNARAYLRFGHVREAERMFREILGRWRCGSAAEEAAHSLLALYGLQGRRDELARLELAGPRNPHCRSDEGPCYRADTYRIDARLLQGSIVDDPFRRAMEWFHQAEHGPARDAVGLYEQAASEMDTAVGQHPLHHNAALAYYYVALALERSGRLVSAQERYARITREFNSSLDANGHELRGEDYAQRINILEVASFRAAVNAERNYDYDAAVRWYRAVVDDPRFADAADHAAHAHDALASIALLAERLAAHP